MSAVQQASFEKGDVIDFCGDQFLVLENHGTSGTVREYPKGQVISPFYWNFDGAECIKVGTFKQLAH